MIFWDAPLIHVASQVRLVWGLSTTDATADRLQKRHQSLQLLSAVKELSGTQHNKTLLREVKSIESTILSTEGCDLIGGYKTTFVRQDWHFLSNKTEQNKTRQNRIITCRRAIKVIIFTKLLFPFIYSRSSNNVISFNVILLQHW